MPQPSRPTSPASSGRPTCSTSPSPAPTARRSAAASAASRCGNGHRRTRCRQGHRASRARLPRDRRLPRHVASGHNAFHGLVDRVVYLGPTTHVVLRLADGQTLLVAVPNIGQPLSSPFIHVDARYARPSPPRRRGCSPVRPRRPATRRRRCRTNGPQLRCTRADRPADRRGFHATSSSPAAKPIAIANARSGSTTGSSSATWIGRDLRQRQAYPRNQPCRPAACGRPLPVFRQLRAGPGRFTESAGR